MLVMLATFYLVLPALIATLYAMLWPTVSSRIGVFITMGVGTLFWITRPLIGIGISRARPGQPSDSLWSLLGSRAVAGILIEAAAVCLLLIALSRWLRSP